MSLTKQGFWEVLEEEHLNYYYSEEYNRPDLSEEQ
jgi:hypothetical protein